MDEPIENMIGVSVVPSVNSKPEQLAAASLLLWSRILQHDRHWPILSTMSQALTIYAAGLLGPLQDPVHRPYPNSRS